MHDVSGMKDLEIRWTGGWVRDKLLGITSHDIDVALSTMTGEKFGLALQSYMKDNAQIYEDEAQRQGFKSEIKNLHKIAANPDKSKHLETITTRMFGIEVDFVNLRKELYDEHSRNPKMEFGTPEEDALRRDACCNALFYNLDTQQVEDFTQRGLYDMNKKLLRTPLDPYQTFKDDPLRVLRLIRFAARLEYNIHPDALRAMADPKIHEALRLKITRERVGVEVGKIMTGPDPYNGMHRIYKQGLYKTVFTDPKLLPPPVDDEPFEIAIKSLRAVINDTQEKRDINANYDHSEDNDVKDVKYINYTDDNYGIWDGRDDNDSEDSYGEVIYSGPPLASVFRPTDDVTVAWSLAAYVPYYKLEEGLAVTAAREGIKATNHVVKVLGDAIRLRKKLRDLVQKTELEIATRAEVGVALRDAGKSWRYHILYSLMCDSVDEHLRIVGTRYGAFAKFVEEQKLEDAAELKPIINGKDIQKILGIQTAGSWLKSALNLVVEWQFANPEGTVDDAKAMIEQKRDQIQDLPS